MMKIKSMGSNEGKLAVTNGGIAVGNWRKSTGGSTQPSDATLADPIFTCGGKRVKKQEKNPSPL